LEKATAGMEELWHAITQSVPSMSIALGVRRNCMYQSYDHAVLIKASSIVDSFLDQ